MATATATKPARKPAAKTTPKRAAASTRQKVAAPASPLELLQQFIGRSASPEQVENFMALLERQQDREAAQAFVVSMVAFKKNPPEIIKTNQGSFVGENGDQVDYLFANLGDVCTAIISDLAGHGISHHWQPDHSEAGYVTVVCTLTHEKGHQQSSGVKLPHDYTDGKSDIHAVGSAISYAERYSLLAVCGIAVKGMDNDANKRDFDTSLADQWIAKVTAAPTDDEVVKVWRAGSAAIDAAGDKIAYKEFKTAVENRRFVLQNPPEKTK